MKFLLVFILTIQTVNSSSVEFNEYLKALQSQFKVISLSEESLSDIENELKKDFQFMSSKPYWKSFSEGSNPNHFLTWLTEKIPFKPIWKSVSRYARPDSQQTFDKGNKKNTSNLESTTNQKRIKQAYKKYSDSLQNIESKYFINAEILVVLAAMESRLGKFKLEYKAHEVFLTQLILLEKFSGWIDSQRLDRLIRSARRNLVCLYLWATTTGQQEVNSNWAGACGVVQFLPYNFWMLQDGSGDHEIQLHNLADGFASSAFFLNNKGWGQQESMNFNSGKFDKIQLKALLSYNRNEYYAKGLWNLAQWLKNNKLEKY